MTDAWALKLDPYLDGELSEPEMRDLDSHLRTCPDCASELLHRVQLKRSVQLAGRRYTPSPEFRQKMQKQIAAHPRASVWRIWPAAAATLAAVIVAGFIFGYFNRERLQSRHIASELADLHVATLASPNQVDVISSDRHTVKPWFQGKLPFSFNLPELQNTDFTLLGGRVTYLGQTPGAHLIYQIRKHEISVFIFQDRRNLADFGQENEVSFNMTSWAEGGLRYYVVGDTGPDDIKKLAELLKAVAH